MIRCLHKDFQFSSCCSSTLFEWGGILQQRMKILLPSAGVFVEKGDWDGSVVWSKSPEREHAVLFSKTPVEIYRTMFFHRKEYDFDWHTFDDLQGHRIGVIQGYLDIVIFDRAKKSGKQFNVESVTKEYQNLIKLLKNRIDVFPCSELVCLKILQEQFDQEERNSLVYHPKPWRENALYLIMNKKNERAERLLQAFERGMRSIKENGRYDQMRIDFLNGVYDKGKEDEPVRISTEK